MAVGAHAGSSAFAVEPIAQRLRQRLRFFRARSPSAHGSPGADGGMTWSGAR